MDSAAPISPTPSQRSAHFSSTVTSTETPLAALAEQHVNTWPELVFGKIRGQGLDGISRTNAEYGNCLGDGLKRAQRPLKEATFQLKSETFDANPIKHLLYQDTQPDVQHGRNPLIEVSEAVANNLNDVRNNTQRLVWTGGSQGGNTIACTVTPAPPPPQRSADYLYTAGDIAESEADKKSSLSRLGMDLKFQAELLNHEHLKPEGLSQKQWTRSTKNRGVKDLQELDGGRRLAPNSSALETFGVRAWIPPLIDPLPFASNVAVIL